jgi:hypothetical protein
LTAEKRGEPPGRAWLAAEVLVVFVFGISRLVYRVVFDVRFDTSPTSDFIQYLDAWFVEHDFLRSVLYLHHQAPLQILVAQGCIKLLGMRQGAVFLEALYLAMGLSLSLALLRILRRLGAPIVLSIVAVSLYGAAPTSVLYESWLFYPLPTATLLTFSLLALLRYYRLGTFGAALVFFSLLGGLALLRATFGALFICAAAGILLFRPPLLFPPPSKPNGSSRRTILKAAALPILVVALNTAKTSWLVGHPFGSALLWENLCVKIYGRLRPADQTQLGETSLISHAANFMGIMSDASAYGEFYVPHAPTGVPLLDLDKVPGGGHNSHALEHVLVAERYYRHDAIYLLTHYPGAYAESVWNALSVGYVSSPEFADGMIQSPNFQELESLRSAADRAFVPISENRFLALIVGLPLAWVYGIHRLIGVRAAAESERASTVAISYALFAIGYAAAVTLLISFGDFSRYRFDVDPMYLVLFVLFVGDVQKTAKRGLGRLLRHDGRAHD